MVIAFPRPTLLISIFCLWIAGISNAFRKAVHAFANSVQNTQAICFVWAAHKWRISKCWCVTPDANSAPLDVNLPFERVFILNVFVLFPIVFRNCSSLAGTRWITYLNDLHWFYNCFVKSARRFAELCDAIFAHALGSRNVVLLVLESRSLKFWLLVIVACFGVQRSTLFEFLRLFHCFYFVFVGRTYVFALTSYAQTRPS